jgi:rhomboid protease GluP
LILVLVAGLLVYGLLGPVNTALHEGMQAEAAYKQGDYHMVIQHATDALEKGGSATAQLPLFYRGLAYSQTGDLNEAIQDYDRLVGLTPNDPAAHYNLARILQLNGQKDESLHHAKRAAELEPSNKQYQQLVQELSQ